MSGYASDQFYNFGGYEKGSSINRKPDDNPNFNFPGPTTPDVFNRPSGPKRVGTKMQRGFIRGIYPAVLGRVSNQSAGKVKQRRLFFQFNPTTLDRSVQMSTSILNPLLQDPANLLQPVPGMSDFAFDMLFNRESEVASATYSDANYNLNSRFDELASRLDNYGGSNYRQSDVATLGVLADLHILDSIIGQSISQDMVDFLKAYWANASNLSQQDTFESGDGSASFSFDDASFTTTVEKNLGNSAFLSPLPIRIVFSSLFMVEGFVTASSVQFIKFSKNYVPTMCKVTLQVRALYMGFAREKAYLTDALQTAVADMVEQQKQDNNTSAKMRNFAYYGPSFVYYSPQVKKVLPGNGEVSISNYGFSFYNFWNSDSTSGTINDGHEMRLQGTLKSWVTPALAQSVANQECEWTFTGKVTFTEVLPSGEDGATLLEEEIKYYRDNLSKTLTSEEIAGNANKKTSESDSQTNKYAFAYGPNTRRNKMENANSSVRIDIEHTVTVMYTANSGPQKETAVTRQKAIINPTVQDWGKFNAQGIQFRLENRVPTSGRGAFLS